MKTRWLGGIAMASSLLVSAHAQALSDSYRSQNWEASFRVSNTEGDRYKGDSGSVAETDASVGWGLGLGYNVNENFAVSGSFNWADVDYKANIIPAAGNGSAAFDINGTLQTSTLNINGTYSFLRKSLTPFVTGGIGASYIDTNIPNGPPVPVCWYDPWYGYYCGSVIPTKDETNFSYNVGAGLRWDVVDNFFIKATANKLWIEASGNIGHPDFLSYSVDFGFMFY